MSSMKSSPDLHDLGVAQLVAKLAAREVSSVEVTQHFLARIRDRHQAPAAAHEDAHPELLLEGPDLLRHSRLRRMQRRGRLGNVQVPACDFLDVAQLLQVHAGRLYNQLLSR